MLFVVAHGDTNRNKCARLSLLLRLICCALCLTLPYDVRDRGWNSPIPTRFEPCCEKCAMNTYDHDMDPTTACVACEAGKRTYATGSGDCFMEKCPAGQCGVSPLATAGAPDTLDVTCAPADTSRPEYPQQLNILGP